MPAEDPVNASRLSARVLGDLSRRASFVFRGRINAIGKCNLDGVEPDDRMATVRVNEVIVAPPVLGDLTGKTVTVYLQSPKGIRSKDEAIFFATSWHYGRNIGVMEIGRTSMATAKLSQTVIDERLKEYTARLEVRIRRAQLIISGRVISTFRSEHRDLPGMYEGIEWWEAEMWVGTVEKGQPPKGLHIFYPVGGDREWGPVPKCYPGQLGVWLLAPVSEPDADEPKRRRDKKQREEVQEDKLMALHPLDYQAISTLPQVQDLLRRTNLP
jgi:hypothetical protein